MTAQTISTPEEYQRALKRLEELRRSDPNGTEAQELQQSVSTYESQNPNARAEAGKSK